MIGIFHCIFFDYIEINGPDRWKYLKGILFLGITHQICQLGDIFA